MRYRFSPVFLHLLAVVAVLCGCRTTVEPVEDNKSDAEIRAYQKGLQGRDLSAGELLKEALLQLKTDSNEKAIVALYLFLDEVEPYGARLTRIYQDVRFKLATLLMEEKRMSEAVVVLDDYLNTAIVEREKEAREMQAQCIASIDSGN